VELADPGRAAPSGFHAHPDVRSVRQAREHVGHLLEDAGWPDPAVERACLVTSELAANAVLHAGTGWRVRCVPLDVGLEGVRVEVRDADGAHLPALQPGAPERVGGLGLHLVDAICRAWGVEQRGSGKVVWCELHRDELADEAGPAADR
jgi:anti-sigma regulatory factor (Ser/Thr protein kinase)